MSVFRRLLERLARGRVLKRSIDVDGRNVTFFVSPDAQLKYLLPGKHAFDQDLIQIAVHFLTQQSTVWDVGANVGTFTFAAAAVASKGTVVSIEPDVWLASILRRSTRLGSNRDRDIRVLPLAIAANNGVAAFMIAERGRAMNALEVVGGRDHMGGCREKQFVPCLTLDTLLESTNTRPSFVKIDVEGAESEALKGATQLINHVRPTFYVEVGPEHVGNVMGVFRSAGYHELRSHLGLEVPTGMSNLLFFPAEDGEARGRAEAYGARVYES